MIGACERAAIALAIGTQLVAAMRALVQEQTYLATTIMTHQHRCRADEFRHIVVLVRDIAGVADIDPGPMPDPLQLLLEDPLVVIHDAADPRRLDQLSI